MQKPTIIKFNGKGEFVGFFKRLFSKSLKISEQEKSKLISVSNPNGVINIGCNLKVPENYFAILCTKGKVCDIFPAGEYDLEAGVIQKATRVCKLAKPNKKGKFKTKFKGHIYFVNLAEFNDNFVSCRGVVVREKRLFTATIQMQGEFSYKVENPKKFMEMLISQYNIASGELAKAKLRLLAGEYADKFVERKKLNFNYFYNENPSIKDGLFEYMKQQFETIGIELSGFDVNKYIFPKKVLKQIESQKVFVENTQTGVVQNQNNAKVKESAQTNLSEEKIEDNEQNLQDMQQGLNNEQVADIIYNNDAQNYKFDIDSNFEEPSEFDLFSNSQVEEQNFATSNQYNYDLQIKNEESNNLENNKLDNQKQNDNLSEKECVVAGEDYYEQEENCDNDLDEQELNKDEEEIYSNDESSIQIKICKNCGQKNSATSEECFSCGESFERICNTCKCKIKKGEFVCPNCGTIII